jgi:hypothetical protein
MKLRERLKHWFQGRPATPVTPPAPTSCPFCGKRPHAGTCGPMKLVGRRSLTRRQSYDDYISSSAWGQKRQEFRAWWIRGHGAWACAVCGAKGALHVHHMRYSNFGHEAMEDLLPLCARHHQELHARQRRAS